MNIYISSSWKNRVRVRALAVALRELGHVVYDFTDPASRGEPELPPERFPQQFDPALHDYSEYLNQSPEYRRAVEGNRRWLIEKCDLCLLLLPCGADSHADWGVAVGAGKRSIIIGHPPKDERTPSHLWAEAIFKDEATALDYIAYTPHLLSLYWTPTAPNIQKLYDHMAHGDAEHRRWLREHLFLYFGVEVPS